MKCITIISFLLAISSSCKNDRKISDLIIEKSKDTVSISDTITVYLHIKNYRDSRVPSFHILYKGNDDNIPFDEEQKCGVFMGQSIIKGKNIWNGYVEYYDTIGNFKKEEFSFSFFVR